MCIFCGPWQLLQAEAHWAWCILTKVGRFCPASQRSQLTFSVVTSLTYVRRKCKISKMMRKHNHIMLRIHIFLFIVWLLNQGRRKQVGRMGICSPNIFGWKVWANPFLSTGTVIYVAFAYLPKPLEHPLTLLMILMEKDGKDCFMI